MQNQEQVSSSNPVAGDVIMRSMVVAQIDARLAGTIGDKELAAWAFDHFYAEETGNIDYEVGSEPLLASVLDSLMFGDDPHFRLSENELLDLRTRLVA